jgi:pimeloyl-ACP methyl ester carboxylesterase
MSALTSPFRTPSGEREYLAAYAATMQLWPVPYEHLDISGQYGRTHVVAAGRPGAPALVLLHADYFSATMWAANIEDFSREHRVYAVDLMGQPGKSVPDRPLRNREDAAAWLTEVLDGLRLEQPTLVGMSYGGWFTLNFAIRVPDRVNRIVILSPGGSFLNERASFYVYTLPSMLLPFLPQHLLFDRFARRMFVPANLRDPIFRAINERLGHQCYLGFRHFRLWKYWGSQSIAPHVFSDEELRGLQKPTLLLMGQQEALYDSAAALERARRLIPQLESDLIPQANHAMTIEQHAVVDQRVLAFLNERELEAAA